MLNAADMSVITLARDIVKASKDSRAAAVAEQLQAILDATTHARHTMQTAALARHADRQGRPPALLYLVECAPGWRQVVTGSGAAHAKLAEALAEHGSKRLPTLGSLAAMLSKNGVWDTLVETDNGTVAISVTRQPAQTTGTDLAPRKDRAKNPKSP